MVPSKKFFVDFVEVEKIAGQVLALSILEWVSMPMHGLSSADISYDGASNYYGRSTIRVQGSPLFSKRPYRHCTSIVLLIASIWQ